MKVVVYSTRSFEKELIAKANRKKHDITLISNALTEETTCYAAGKDAVLVSSDDVSEPVIKKLASYGVRFIATRTNGTDHIDKIAAAKARIKIANVPSYSPQSTAEHVLALVLALNRKLIQAVERSKNFDFRLDGLTGFNLYKKTVGIIGLGKIGTVAAKIFAGFGCRVIAYDPKKGKHIEGVENVSLLELYASSDIISLHLPLNQGTHYLINSESLAKMKKGVMLINTSRGGLVNTVDALQALNTGKLGFLGADVYEHEHGLFYQDHHQMPIKDSLLEQLMAHPNVLITPHQAFLTIEALQEVAEQTISNLDKWQEGKCVGKACSCNHQCDTEHPETLNEKKHDFS